MGNIQKTKNKHGVNQVLPPHSKSTEFVINLIWKVLVGLIGLIGLVGLVGLIGLIGLVKLIVHVGQE